MAELLRGIHHVTAIAGDPQRNLDFYTGVLGLRLVKLTVNFDDPKTYHLYYGDGIGHPGTLLTFFAWPGAPRGRVGTGQVKAAAFSIPEHSGEFWAQRLGSHGVVYEFHSRFEQEVLSFTDPDHLRLELVANRDVREPWEAGLVPAKYAIRGLHSVTLAEAGYERTAELLEGAMAFHKTAETGTRSRFQPGKAGAGAIVDVECLPDLPPGRIAVGTVHHAAFRTTDPNEQSVWRDRIVHAHLNPTPVIDRKYFRSIYFREPGGVLFEIATDPPGFTVDESVAALGTRLMLPDWLEPERAKLETYLPQIRLPMLARGA